MVPGPGAYKPEIEKTLGKTFRSTPSTYISNPKFARFPEIKEKTSPGPGAYYNPEEFIKSGYQFSQNKYCGARKFALSSRETLIKKKLDTPGPGSYRLPSEFGYYENLNAKKKNASMPNLNANIKAK